MINKAFDMDDGGLVLEIQKFGLDMNYCFCYNISILELVFCLINGEAIDNVDSSRYSE